jgi:hypothetical protein
VSWLTWRQFRQQAVTAAAALAAFAILLGATGPHLNSLYATSGIRGCQPASCGHLASNFLQQAFQWTETGIFFALTLVLTGFCCWWVRRRHHV